ncbi:MAG TPA: hypothetical protein VLF61_03975 [Rhabdochlamydiaceae bacterium]|nr:hypothetical protein [Rhabdochlamydiaceae bacterium]
MKYVGFLLTIPILVFATTEYKEQTGYKIEEQGMFDNDQLEKMLVRFDAEEEDYFSLFEQDESEMVYDNNLEEDVSSLSKNRQKDAVVESYEEDSNQEFFPSEEMVPERSKALKRLPVRKKEAVAASKKQVSKPRQVPIEMAEEEPVMVPRQQAKKAPMARVQPSSPAKKQMPARAPAVGQNKEARKSAQAPVTLKKKSAVAHSGMRNNKNMAQRKTQVMRKAPTQKKRPSNVQRPTIELDQFEE